MIYEHFTVIKKVIQRIIKIEITQSNPRRANQQVHL